jgi:hypothetical protein
VLGCKYGLLVSYITLFLEFYFLSILLVMALVFQNSLDLRGWLKVEETRGGLLT